MWVHYAEPETKAQSKPGNNWFLPPKKFKLFPFAGKVMLVAFCNSRGIKLAHFMPKGKTMNATYSLEVILKKTQRKTKNVASQDSPEKCPSFA